MNEREFMTDVLAYLTFESFSMPREDLPTNHPDFTVRGEVLIRPGVTFYFWLGPGATGQIKIDGAIVPSVVPWWADDPGSTGLVTTTLLGRRVSYRKSDRWFVWHLVMHDLDSTLPIAIEFAVECAQAGKANVPRTSPNTDGVALGLVIRMLKLHEQLVNALSDEQAQKIRKLLK